MEQDANVLSVNLLNMGISGGRIRLNTPGGKMKPSEKAIDAACKAVKLALDNCWATSVGYLDHALDEAYKIDVAPLESRIEELETALRLNLAVGPKDPILS